MPKSATADIIVGSARFRSRGRFPALSYFHRDTLVSTLCIEKKSLDDAHCDADADGNDGDPRRPRCAAAVSLCPVSAEDVRRTS